MQAAHAGSQHERFAINLPVTPERYKKVIRTPIGLDR